MKLIFVCITGLCVVCAVVLSCVEPTNLFSIAQESSPGGINVGLLPKIAEYQRNQSFSSNGLVVTHTFIEDGIEQQETVKDYDLFWDGKPLADGDKTITEEPGTKTIVIRYEREGEPQEQWFSVDVLPYHFAIENTPDWYSALDAIKIGDRKQNYVVTVHGDPVIRITAVTSSNFGSGFAGGIMLNGTGTFDFTTGGSGSMLHIANNQTFIIDGDITLNGRSQNLPLVRVEGDHALLVLRRGRIKGNIGSVASPSSSYGGGVSLSRGRFIMSGGSIDGNTAGSGGGVHVKDGGRFAMSGGRIDNCKGYLGGAVHVASKGTFSLSGGTISGNSGDYIGGGVYVDGGSFDMSGGTISGNSGVHDGGGVFIGEEDTFTLSESSGKSIITGNKAGSRGGGVYSAGFFTMSGGEISLNYTERYPSGNADAFYHGGGGVFIEGQLVDATFAMSGGTITGNHSSQFGGGVFVLDGKGFPGGTDTGTGSFTMSGGEISGNKTTSYYTGKKEFEGGAGIFICGGSFALSGSGTITGNTSRTNGGGIGVIFSGSTIAIQGGTIGNNTATYHGGGVYLHEGSFTKGANGGSIYGTGHSAANTMGNGYQGRAVYYYHAGTGKKRNATLNSGDALSNVSGQPGISAWD